MALGRVEGRQFTASVWFAVGLAFSVLMILLFGWIWAGDNTGTWQEFVDLMPWFAHPLVGMVVLAAYRATTRAARDGADELFETCPTAPATRTAGFLLSAAVPVATLGVFLAVLATAVAFKSPFLHGALGADSVADVLGALVLGAGGVALGVALGRWVRFGLVPVVAVVLIGFLATAVVSGSSPHDWKPLGRTVHRPLGEFVVTGVHRHGGVLASPVADRPHRRRRHRGRGPSPPGPAGGAGRGGRRRRRAGRRDRGNPSDAFGVGCPDRRSQSPARNGTRSVPP